MQCICCNLDNLSKNTVAINKKLLGRNIKNYYCLDCLADFLNCSIEDIIEKIYEFKENGCALFI
ncbi:hypothetical protein AN641_04440 [Candidatus Epulonipiscioides gigas]|nr:hypothetical protein AN641_04440 [Epulopiscium sp. SCG-C07WGA-EpuloA2]